MLQEADQALAEAQEEHQRTVHTTSVIKLAEKGTAEPQVAYWKSKVEEANLQAQLAAAHLQAAQREEQKKLAE